jgi:hypothetical protein
MIGENDPILAELLKVETSPLSAAFRERTLAIARTNLPPRGKRPLPLVFADYMPPVSLVPSLLISAAVVFVVDAFLRIARFFWFS